MSKKELAEKQNTEVAVLDYEALAGEGNNFDQDDLTTPFLKLLGKLSPELDTVEGAKNGAFYNTGTRQVFEQPVVVIPVAYERQFLEWVPRDAGGGFRGAVDKDYALSLEQNEKGQYLHPNGNLVIDTRLHYVLQVVDGDLVPCIISLKSTAIKRSKNFNALISNLRLPGKNGKFNPPCYSHTYIVSTTDEQKGEDKWKLPQFEIGALVEDPEVFTAAKEFHDIVVAGGAKVDYAQTEDNEKTAPDNYKDEPNEF